jgi:hypothetical protein
VGHAAVQTGGDAPAADVVSGDGAKPMIGGSAFGLEAYWWSAKRVESALPLIPFVKFELSPTLVLDLHFPISFVINARVNRDEKAVLGLGNPTVGLTYFTTDGHLTWFFGGRLSAPLAGASDAEPWITANGLSAIAMTLYDAHYWVYKYLPIGMRGGLEYAGTPSQKGTGFFRAEIAPTLYIPLDANDARFLGARRTAEFYYQMRVEGEFRSASGWGGGAGLQLVHAISEGDTFGRGDNAQAALEPFGSYTSGSTFARLGILIAVDPPLGFGFDSGLLKVAALRLSLGSYF